MASSHLAMVMNIFEANATQLRDLHAAIKNAFRRRNQGDLEWKAWEEACRRFHTSYDALAFLEGLETPCHPGEE